MSSITRTDRLKIGRYIYIYVGDQRFSLTETQIRSEPECIFVDLCRGGSEANLDADANIFSLINAHLKGYEIFPLPLQGIPCGGGYFLGSGPGSGSARIIPYLSKEATLKNLLRDATDFGMINLVRKIEREMARVESLHKAEKKALDDDAEAMKGFVVLD